MHVCNRAVIDLCLLRNFPACCTTCRDENSSFVGQNNAGGILAPSLPTLRTLAMPAGASCGTRSSSEQRRHCCQERALEHAGRCFPVTEACRLHAPSILCPFDSAHQHWSHHTCVAREVSLQCAAMSKCLSSPRPACPITCPCRRYIFSRAPNGASHMHHHKSAHQCVSHVPLTCLQPWLAALRTTCGSVRNS